MTDTRPLNTGNVQPLKMAGRLVLTVRDIGENDYVGRYVCRALGWSRAAVTGSGDTAEAAIADWCALTGNNREDVRRRCEFRYYSQHEAEAN